MALVIIEWVSMSPNLPSIAFSSIEEHPNGLELHYLACLTFKMIQNKKYFVPYCFIYHIILFCIIHLSYHIIHLSRLENKLYYSSKRYEPFIDSAGVWIWHGNLSLHFWYSTSWASFVSYSQILFAKSLQFKILCYFLVLPVCTCNFYVGQISKENVLNIDLVIYFYCLIK